MFTVKPTDFPLARWHEYLLGAVAPRPIAFVSSMDKDGKVNLAPFSFFNVFGSNPPTLIFSPSLSGRTGKSKHTLDNLKETDECVVNIVNYAMVQQTSLASTEFPKGVNEFLKAGFTELKSELVKPPRVAESPAQMECRVKQIIHTGSEGGAANLVICEILLLHINENVLEEDKTISPYKMEQVARMGKNYYARMIPEAIFEVAKPRPQDALSIGFDQLPEGIKHSKYLSGNELAHIAANERLPDEKELFDMGPVPEIRLIIDKYGHDFAAFEKEMHLLAAQEIEQHNVWFAFKILMIVEHVRESLIQK
jgi:flavin reductase (DIM6/NTAB) family NADH-FMN oxidoreductase RutF